MECPVFQIVLRSADAKMTAMNDPQLRPRRLRRGQILRDAVADVSLSADDLIYPLFVKAGKQANPVSSMPGVSQLPVDQAMDTIRQCARKGLKQFILFGVTSASKKDASGSYAREPSAPVNLVLQAVREADLDVIMYSDLCFCEYTDHGHCGVLCEDDDKWIVDNDRTLELLGQTAVRQAQSGADVVAPSGMIDGQVGTIRRALDDHGFSRVMILSYSIKYASNLYGPFRDAGEGGMKFGDRQGYQMDFRRHREWQTELEIDLQQGADMVMVKPAAAYLDVIYQVRQKCQVPLAAYHVSGEYAQIHAASQRGWLDLKETALEYTYAIKRAGADLILTYFAPELVKWLS